MQLYTNVCSGSQPDSDYAAVDKACYAGSTNSIILRVPATIAIRRAYVTRKANGRRAAGNFKVTPRAMTLRSLRFPMISEALECQTVASIPQ